MVPPLLRACALTTAAAVVVLVAVQGAIELAGDNTDGLDHIVEILVLGLLANVAGAAGCVWLLRVLATRAVGRAPGWGWAAMAVVVGATAALLTCAAGFAINTGFSIAAAVLASVPVAALSAWRLLELWSRRADAHRTARG